MKISFQSLALSALVATISTAQCAITLINPVTTGDLEYVPTPWTIGGGSTNNHGIYDVNGPLPGAIPVGGPTMSLQRSGFGYSGILRLESTTYRNNHSVVAFTNVVSIFADTDGAATLTSSNLIGAGTSENYLPRIGDVITYGMSINTGSDEALDSFGRISLLIGNSLIEVGVLTQTAADEDLLPGIGPKMSAFKTFSNTFTVDASNINEVAANLQFTGGVDQVNNMIYGDRFFVTVEPVPEPSSALLGLLGLAFFAARRKRA